MFRIALVEAEASLICQFHQNVRDGAGKGATWASSCTLFITSPWQLHQEYLLSTVSLIAKRGWHSLACHVLQNSITQPCLESVSFSVKCHIVDLGSNEYHESFQGAIGQYECQKQKEMNNYFLSNWTPPNYRNNIRNLIWTTTSEQIWSMLHPFRNKHFVLLTETIPNTFEAPAVQLSSCTAAPLNVFLPMIKRERCRAAPVSMFL